MEKYNSTLTKLSAIKDQIDELKNLDAVLLDELSAIDNKINSIYHMIELLPLPGGKLLKLASKLKTLLTVRRDIKETRSLLQSVITNNLAIPANSKRDIRHNKYTKKAQQAYNLL